MLWINQRSPNCFPWRPSCVCSRQAWLINFQLLFAKNICRFLFFGKHQKGLLMPFFHEGQCLENTNSSFSIHIFFVFYFLALCSCSWVSWVTKVAASAWVPVYQFRWITMSWWVCSCAPPFPFSEELHNVSSEVHRFWLCFIA